MGSLKDTKRRIRSVKNTQKITQAMKMVSAAKFARAAAAVQGARPYARALEHLAKTLVHQSVATDMPVRLAEQPNTEAEALHIVLSTDRGLCGSLNNALFKFFRHKEARGKTWALGRRGNQFLTRVPEVTVEDAHEKVTEKPSYGLAKELAERMVADFLDGKLSGAFLWFPRFQSALQQEPTVKQLLPISIETADLGGDANKVPDIIVEPGLAELTERALSQYLVSEVYQAILETTASEHGARMTAMDSASTNAKEFLKQLQLEYNRGRQAAITKELIEIVSGAEAL